jgi:hypothetical protein
LISERAGDFEPVQAVVRLFSSFNKPWMVAGGWAISLHLRRVVRPHKDVDIAVFREHQLNVQRYLNNWQMYVAQSGTLRHWAPGEQLARNEHVIWAWKPGVAAGRVDLQPDVELLFDERTATHWVYRREPSITLPLDIACLKSSDGIPYLAPEIVLLYKAKGTREADDTDFRAALPLLSDRQRAWLATSVSTVQPGHRWLRRL